MRTKLRVPRRLALLWTAFVGARYLRPLAQARNTFFAGLTIGLIVFGVVFQRAILHEPESGSTLASALEYLPPAAVPFREALEVTWRREMGLAGTLENKGTALLASRVPPALCPAGAASLYAGPDSERLRQLVNALDAALRSGTGRGEAARQALAELDAARLAGGYPLAEFIQDYNLARGDLLISGDSAGARRLLAPYFTDAPDNPLREGSLDPARSSLLYHARMVAALASLQLRDTLSISHFRGGVRMLKVLAPYSRTALAGDGSQGAFAVDPGAARCDGTADTGLSSSMDVWAGLVAAYRQADGFADTRDLAWELEDLGDDRTDPLYPLLRHGVRVANGTQSPVRENFIWAASNLRRVYAANRRNPDPRLEAARAVLLMDLVDNDAWMRAVSSTQKVERCTILGRLAGEMEANSRQKAESAGFADSLRAALAVHVHARRRGCEGAAEPVDDGLRSDWIRLGARMLGDSLGARTEEWRLAMRGGAADPEQVVAGTIRRSQALQATLTPSLSQRILTQRGDTAYRFVARWRRALLAEVADSLRSRSAANQVDSGELDRLPDVMLGLALHACGRPRQCFTPADVHPVLGTGLPLPLRVRYFTGNYPVLSVVLLMLLAGAAFLAGVRRYFWTWRRRMFVGEGFYARERGEE
jgi:hypothetical protein